MLICILHLFYIETMSHETFGVDESIETLNDMIYSTSTYYPHFLHHIWTSWRCLKYHLLSNLPWRCMSPWTKPPERRISMTSIPGREVNFFAWKKSHEMFRDETDARMISLLEMVEVKPKCTCFGVFLQYLRHIQKDAGCSYVHLKTNDKYSLK